MTLLQPVWLVLILPLAAAMWRWRCPSRLLTGIRAVLLLSVVLAMCAPVIRLPSKAGVVVVVADRSLSMPSSAAGELAETVRLVGGSMSSSDALGVVSFGRNAAVELAPGGGEFTGFSATVDAEGSNLVEALQTAVSLIPADRPGRILVVSDGQWTHGSPQAAAIRSAGRDIAIDYRLRSRSAANDLAVLRLDAPSEVTPGESFLVTAWVRSPVAQNVNYELRRGGAVIASGSQQVAAGAERLVFRDRAGPDGLLDYTLVLAADAQDPLPENNQARALVGVSGAKPLLCVRRSPQSRLPALLAAGGLDIRVRDAEQCTWTLEELSCYSGVLIENTPAEKIGPDALELISAWVRQAGTGLMLTGGMESYGPGGYYKSPLEEILPVSMELRREHRKLALAVVVALDRSGSMAVSVGGGKTKMDLANLGTAQVVDMLSAMDEFGCLAVDSIAHLIVPLTPVSDKAAIRNKVLRIDSQGGGIFVYEALSNAAAMLSKATPATRHIILFSDAADSEEPGNYVELLRKCRQANMTVSVIGLGSKSDCDARLLEDIAREGGGRCLFTDQAKDLPRLFAQDMFSVARSAFITDATAVKATAGLAAITGRAVGDLPPVGGYNLCYLRPGANLAAVTLDEYAAPLAASWNAGSGRVLCYTGDADGKHAGPMARWAGVGDFLTGLAKWTAGAQTPLPPTMLLTQELVGGACRIRLHLDPARGQTPFDGAVSVGTLVSTGGRPPRQQTLQMQWTSPDELSLELPLSGGETALSVVRIPGLGDFAMPPVCLPYSQEYAPSQPEQGHRELERLARVTGGVERIDLASIWNDMPKRRRDLDLAPALLAMAAVLLLSEVLERRTGAVGSLLTRLASVKLRPAEAPHPPQETVQKTRERKPTPTRSTVAAGKPPADAVGKARADVVGGAGDSKPAAKAAESPPSSAGLDDALRRARSQARKRTGP